MSWHKITLRQIQPIHLGHRKHGVINETRVFITGQMMWGALTNAYFHQTGQYDKELFENISCFYPMIEGAVFYPRFEDGAFCLGSYSEKEFRQLYVITLLSTAINPNTKNSKDESLHEIDVILPNNLDWVGYVNCDNEKLEKLKEIYIGGDSRYGFGLIKLIECQEEAYTQSPKKGVIEEFTNNEPLSNFVKFGEHKQFDGMLELLAEYDFSKNSPTIVNSGFYIGVGSRIF